MKFLIIDDHPIVREGVAAVLRQIDGAVEILEAGDGKTGLAQLAAHADFDCVLLDLRMTGMAGMPTLEQMRQEYPAVPLVVVPSSEDPADARRALAAGARGYIPESVGRNTMLAAIRLVLAGEVYVPPLVLAGDMLTFGGTLKVVQFGGNVPQAGQSFDLFDWGTSEGQFSSLDITSAPLADGMPWDNSRLYIDGTLTVAAVPEPSGYIMMLAGIGLMGFMVRRRRQRQAV